MAEKKAGKVTETKTTGVVALAGRNEGIWKEVTEGIEALEEAAKREGHKLTGYGADTLVLGQALMDLDARLQAIEALTVGKEVEVKGVAS